jgi:hypothetical protein
LAALRSRILGGGGSSRFVEESLSPLPPNCTTARERKKPASPRSLIPSLHRSPRSAAAAPSPVSIRRRRASIRRSHASPASIRRRCASICRCHAFPASIRRRCAFSSSERLQTVAIGSEEQSGTQSLESAAKRGLNVSSRFPNSQLAEVSPYTFSVMSFQCVKSRSI